MTKRNIIIVSVSLNLLLLAFFGKMALNRGGLRNLTNLFSQAKASQPKNTTKIDRIELFDLLPTTKGDIVFVGDSLTSPCEWVELFGNIRVKNRGIAGDTTEDVLLRLDTVLASYPDKIFIMIGINDLSKRIPIDMVVDNYKQMMEMISEQSPGTEVYIQSVLPVTKERLTKGRNKESIITLNRRLKTLAAQFGHTYVDLFSLVATRDNHLGPGFTTDGLHLSGQGYLVWKNAIEKYVQSQSGK